MIRTGYDDGVITHKKVLDFFDGRGLLTAYHQLLDRIYKGSKRNQKQSDENIVTENITTNSTSSITESLSENGSASNIPSNIATSDNCTSSARA